MMNDSYGIIDLTAHPCVYKIYGASNYQDWQLRK